jgi:hypothetical protein
LHSGYNKNVYLKIDPALSRSYKSFPGKDINGHYILQYSQNKRTELLSNEEFEGNCRDLCNATPNCGGFILNANYKECWLKDTNSLTGKEQFDSVDRILVLRN